jgi:two-component system sensor histidine kinase KdpD
LRVLLFILECALGVVAVVLVSALSHWAGWLLPVAALLYLLIVVPIALLCGFWQAVIVSLSAVFLHSYFTTRQAQANLAADPANSVTLLAFVLVALVVSRLSARVKDHAQEAESWGGQMRDLYEFTRRTLEMNLHVEPGPQLAELVHEIFALEAVAVFDADLHDVYQAGILERGPARAGAERLLLRAARTTIRSTGVGRRVVRLGTVPVGSLVVRGETSPLTNNAIASLIAITFDRYRAFANESRIETERRTEQLRHRPRQPGPRLQDAADRHSRGLDRPGRDGPSLAGAGGAGGADRRTDRPARQPDHAPADHRAPGCRRGQDSRHAGGRRVAD